LKTLLIVVPLLLGIIALGYTVAANLLRVWMNHRVKMALLEQLQADPDRRDGLEHLQELVNSGTAGSNRGQWVDHGTVGVTLATIGILSALGAWCCGGQGWTAGAFIGGVICVAVGFILTLLGLITRYLARLPISPRRP